MLNEREKTKGQVGSSGRKKKGAMQGRLIAILKVISNIGVRSPAGNVPGLMNLRSEASKDAQSEME